VGTQNDRGENKPPCASAEITQEIADSVALLGAIEVFGRNRRRCNSSGRAEWRPRKVGGKRSMPLLQLLMILVVVGVLLWLVNNFIPMQSQIKSILNAVVVIGVVLWLLNVFGLFHSFSHIRVGS
jgi:hypothetical protein